MLSLIGLIGALVLLIVLTIRGMNLFIATPLCALIVALTSGLPLLPPLAAEGQGDLVSAYMSGFTSFVAAWFFMFLLGSIFGKLMEDTGAADSVARWVISHIGPKRAALAVVLACAILTYGGVSLFVVAFSVYPTALALFRVADLPRRFIPATLAFGSVTFTMTSAGSPEIQNWIPIQYLGTSPWAPGRPAWSPRSSWRDWATGGWYGCCAAPRRVAKASRRATATRPRPASHCRHRGRRWWGLRWCCWSRSRSTTRWALRR
ncbi:GntP family permease [Alkalisalibacterium limincola]|uniref:GntP family permease n=1 Tax=Alkalisalibacterium limincola TaxID=2699169 RepID=UPI001C9C0871|nr:SLC13 family permease [Alkalisalibacterium limincola]